MLLRNVSVFAFACMLGVVGCRDNGSLTPADLSMGGGGTGGTGGGGGTGDMAIVMKNYMPSTIAAMRMGAPGDYELDDVIAIGVTPSGTHMYAQDAAGGDFTAIRANCPGSGTHMCTVASTVKTAVGHKVTLKGTYVKGKVTSGATEDFYIDSITDNGAGTMPPVATVMLADVQQSSVAMAATTKPTNAKYWFQHVTVMSPGTLTVYDLSPAVFQNTQASATCALWYGWGIAPSGTSGANTMNSCDASCATNPPGAACAQPTGVALNAAEVLIGTDFYTVFKNSSDCKCYSKFSDTILTSSSMTTKLGGILIYDTVYMSSPVQPYIYLAPLDDTNDVAF